MNLKDEPQKKKKKAKLLSFKYFVFDFVRITGALPTLIALRPKLYYESKAAKKKIRGAALIVGNHVSFLDPVRMYTAFWYRRVRLVAIKELFRKKAGNWFFRQCGCIPIDPEKPDFRTVNEVCDRLGEGLAVGIFPEGHVNRTDNPINEFKPGVLLMAMRSNAPIVPVYFKPTRDWYERCRIAVGEPVDLKQLANGERLTIAELEKAAKLMQQKVIGLSELIDKKKKKQGEEN